MVEEQNYTPRLLEVVKVGGAGGQRAHLEFSRWYKARLYSAGRHERYGKYPAVLNLAHRQFYSVVDHTVYFTSERYGMADSRVDRSG